MKAAIGETNHVMAPVGWDKSYFNSWLGENQLILFDEAKVKTDGHNENVNKLKRIINDSQNIEKKGKDADKTQQNFASFFITQNNGTKNFKLEMDNRPSFLSRRRAY